MDYSPSVFERPALDHTEAFTNFIEAMRIAESAAKQLAFYQQRPAWLKVRLALENTRELATMLAVKKLQ
jgi:hypothetical protein